MLEIINKTIFIEKRVSFKSDGLTDQTSYASLWISFKNFTFQFLYSDIENVMISYIVDQA